MRFTWDVSIVDYREMKVSLDFEDKAEIASNISFGRDEIHILIKDGTKFKTKDERSLVDCVTSDKQCRQKKTVSKKNFVVAQIVDPKRA